MDFFYIQLLLSFIVGAVWISSASILAEKYGTKLGGLFAGLPSTTLIALFFIAWTQSLEIAVEVTAIAPVINAVICLFILSFVLLSRKKNFWFSLALSLSVWFVLSFLIALTSFSNFFFNLIIYVIVLAFCYYILEKKLSIKSGASHKIKYTPSLLLFRGILSGSIIAFAIFATKTFGPFFGGIFAFFPAAFLGTLLLTYLSQGKLFSTSVMKASIISAATVVIYSGIVRCTYLPFGLILGTLISITISFASGAVIYYFIIKKMI